jgi:hypothetical protein
MIKAKVYRNVHWMVLYKFRFLFRYENQNGGYGRTWFNFAPYGENVSKHFFSETTWTIETTQKLGKGHYNDHSLTGWVQSVH